MDISKEIESRLSNEAFKYGRQQSEAIRVVIERELKEMGLDLGFSTVLEELVGQVERSARHRFIHDRMTAIVDGLLQQAPAARG